MVNCRRCGKTLASAPSDIRGSIVCPPESRCYIASKRTRLLPGQSSQRDALVVRLHHAGDPHATIARMIEVTPSRITQIIRDRT